MGVFALATVNYATPGGALGGEPLTIEVRDARATRLPGWRECGFELVAHTTTVDDWTDDEQIADVHYGEIEALARELTGCDAALVSDHVKRTATVERRPREQAPVRLVHSDFAADYADVVRYAYRDVKGRGARTLARTGVTSDDIEHAPRIVMMQFWRNIGAPTMDLPLAFCDARTVVPAETRPFLYAGYVAGGRQFHALAVCAPRDDPGRHGWYCYPDMQADEVVAFRTYDTDLVHAGTTWFTPHTAFRDPRVGPGGPPRSSIELRVMCLYL